MPHVRSNAYPVPWIHTAARQVLLRANPAHRVQALYRMARQAPLRVYFCAQLEPFHQMASKRMITGARAAQLVLFRHQLANQCAHCVMLGFFLSPIPRGASFARQECLLALQEVLRVLTVPWENTAPNLGLHHATNAKLGSILILLASRRVTSALLL